MLSKKKNIKTVPDLGRCLRGLQQSIRMDIGDGTTLVVDKCIT